MCGLVNTILGGIIPGMKSNNSSSPAPDYAAQQAATDAKASQDANAKLAARNRRRGASLLATGAGDTGMQGTTPAKTTLGG